MYKTLISLSLLAALALLVFGCEKKPAATETGKDMSMVASDDDTAAAPAFLCAKCGQIKASATCCKPGAEKCAKCGLAKGSPACCKHLDFSKGDAKVCSHCGQVKGSDKCCAAGAEKCPKCGLNKGSVGCCKIKL